ncbi:hypothetical protein BBJ28_00016184 [Nothophytophthora sp. Chile5]|nr:hypothetical protein BBJ28_00016184 [Nothophytophthora sp. Chile5]
MADPEHDAPADPQAASPRSSHPPSGPPDSGRSLSARLSTATATATATTANAFETGSALAEEDAEWTNAADADRTGANVYRSTSAASARSSHPTEVELSSEPKTLEQPEEPELAALRLELTRVRRALFEESEGAADGSPAIVAVREDADGVDANTEFRVVEVADGVYRGQVSPRGPTDSCDWAPHGFGVLTTAKGHVCCGRWLDGTQMGYGTICNATLHYAGECFAMPNTTRSTANTIRGVGFYAFGALFVGSWCGDATSYPVHDVDRYTPHGLGKLTLRSDPSGRDSNRVESGWFQGLHRPFSDAVTTDSDVSTARHYAHLTQPERGLVIADAKLVFWRRNALTRGLGRWRRWSCDLSVQQAVRSRLVALKVQQKAREAEKRAITTQIAALVTQRRHTDAEVITNVEAARMARERGLERRKLHTQRLVDALEHRDLTRVCVSAQQEAVTVLQQELAQILQLLNEAKQAQENCAKSAQRLQILKRQIQKVTMSLNAVTKPAHAADPVQFSPPPTPSRTPRPQHHGDDLHYELVQTPHPTEQFVCDVPGCVCGIPRDVFLRVAATLNGE